MAFRIALLVLAVSVTATAALAGEVVFFEDGRTMEVERVENGESFATLTLIGGGEMAIPLERIVEHRPLSEPEPAEPPGTVVDGGQAWREAAGDYAGLIEDAARRHGIEPALLVALAETESAFDPRAVSPKGARGLLQLMPQTAERFGVSDPFDARQNVEGGARYLSWLIDRFEGRTDLALAGYNAGEGAVDRYQGIPPYRETKRYVTRVLAGADRLARLAP